MKSRLFLIICVVVFVVIVIDRLGTSNNDIKTYQENEETASVTTTVIPTLGQYEVIIDSCRISEDYFGKPIAIVKYLFTNNGDDAVAFRWVLEEAAYQNGVGLDEAFYISDEVNYFNDNGHKEIKKGVTIEVEIAYELNDKTSDIEVEVGKVISYNGKKVTKTFKIA